MSSECRIVREQSDYLSDLSRRANQTTSENLSDRLPDMPVKDTDYAKLVGRRLEIVREGLDFKSKRDFAKDLGVPETNYTKWSVGANLLPAEVAATMREKYGVSLEYMWSKDPKRLKPEYFPMHRTLRPVDEIPDNRRNLSPGPRPRRMRIK